MNKVTTVIHTLLATKWKGQKPRDINSGLCRFFMMDILAYVHQAKEVYHGDFSEFIAGHYWVKYRGKYYDAECPEGVKDWHDLPIYTMIRKQEEMGQRLEQFIEEHPIGEVTAKDLLWIERGE